MENRRTLRMDFSRENNETVVLIIASLGAVIPFMALLLTYLTLDESYAFNALLKNPSYWLGISLFISLAGILFCKGEAIIGIAIPSNYQSEGYIYRGSFTFRQRIPFLCLGLINIVNILWYGANGIWASSPFMAGIVCLIFIGILMHSAWPFYDKHDFVK